MTIQQLRKDLADIREAVKPDADRGQIVIVDRNSRDEEGNLRPETIIKINGKDVSGFTIEEKMKELAKSHIHAYLPKKVPYPGGNCDQPAN